MTKMSLLFVALFVLLGAGQCMFGQDSTVNCVLSVGDARGNACSDSDCIDGCRSGGAVLQQASRTIPHNIILGKLGRQRSSFVYPAFPRTSAISTGGTVGHPERPDNLTISKVSFSLSPQAKLFSAGWQPRQPPGELNPIVLNFCMDPFNPNSTMCSTEYMDETLGSKIYSLNHSAHERQSGEYRMAGSRS